MNTTQSQHVDTEPHKFIGASSEPVGVFPHDSCPVITFGYNERANHRQTLAIMLGRSD
ncbi:hypothetical protein JMJ77_0012899 [Colletotrichum scovillei]|uniref:Uncharacterized protein n=1 Tax=Colletotrichum scovillei TaxID=1209932 RepID=A0A9P7R4N5_9PEZI|nr:hypothetical protein JMJ77_0012899 [Colletotrichum scovillei]KAG7069184.1 hypothetical protein JMJ76_0002859 [Colletotrichum scovillei]KAG7073135.1 hypothetical protein JMJ78_0014115 [Colletotrichum scovillei]